VVEDLTEAMAPGAKVVLLGRGPHTVQLDPERLIVKGASLHGSIGHAGAGAFGRVIELMASGRLDMSRIVTETVSLDDAPAALGRLRDRSLGKCLVVP
jgi:threonine dehydrogenase-like Zn-dependent dehydrogenase